MKKASHPAEQKRVELIWRLVDEPGCSLQPAPARGLAAVEVLEVYPRLLEEPAKVGLGSELPEVPRQLSPREPKRATHIAEDRLLRNAVEPDVAARREVGEVVLDLALEPSTRRTGEGAEPPIETELGSLAPGKWADLAIAALPDRSAGDPHELLFDPAAAVVACFCRGVEA